MDFDDLLLPDGGPLPAAPRRARVLPGALQPGAGGRVPGHQPGPERARHAPVRRAPQHLHRRRHRPVDLRLPGRRHPEHPRVREGLPRRRDHPPGAELPVDRDHPRRRQRRHREQHLAGCRRSCGPRGSGASRSTATGPRTSTTRRPGWRPRSAGCTTPRGSATATWPSSTGPTARAGPWKRRSSARTSPTRWWGGPASTTAGK